MLPRINNQLRTALLTSGNLRPAISEQQVLSKRGFTESQAAAIGARRAELNRKPTVSSK